MFHVYFLQHVARPNNATLHEIAAIYDSQFGRASHALREDLQRACEQIKQVTTWEYVVALMRTTAQAHIGSFTKELVWNLCPVGSCALG